MSFLRNFGARLSSRKFLLTVAAFIAALNQGQPIAAAVVAAIYVAAEAHVDASQPQH